MSITFTWHVTQMEAYPEENDKTNVVFNVHWHLNGIVGEYRAYAYGAQNVTVDPNAPFTPYENLTEEQVVGWVQSAMGEERVAELQSNIAEDIANQIDPPVVTLPIPWSM
jgi:hypothetical protein